MRFKAKGYEKKSGVRGESGEIEEVKGRRGNFFRDLMDNFELLEKVHSKSLPIKNLKLMYESSKKGKGLYTHCTHVYHI